MAIEPDRADFLIRKHGLLKVIENAAWRWPILENWTIPFSDKQLEIIDTLRLNYAKYRANTPEDVAIFKEFTTVKLDHQAY